MLIQKELIYSSHITPQHLQTGVTSTLVLAVDKRLGDKLELDVAEVGVGRVVVSGSGSTMVGVSRE